ncbi:DUF1456 family protein [Marinomonas pollencensis]|uniref:Uncharacterized protein YehS (DUF1456 family) n=1 Tax=Marinomonas pollencensis TaxID=491954 RepID=A0A3E0DLX6_9GAMM|nr:DUF1456 family protein [Marinomonas pollencensis]REG83693.1 uncharacterized protein YehS (DUF1456 family) [Marinomonas pollencensis]
MTNNDILRRLRYTFDLKDSYVKEIFAAADHAVNREQIIAWMKKEEEEGYASMVDIEMARFLNGFINVRRGKREGEQPAPEKRLNNNMIFMKLRIALNLKAEEILEIMQLAEFNMSKHELSAFFRKPDNKHYRDCKDQILRNFIMGLQLKFRPRTDV